MVAGSGADEGRGRGAAKDIASGMWEQCESRLIFVHVSDVIHTKTLVDEITECEADGPPRHSLSTS